VGTAERASCKNGDAAAAVAEFINLAKAQPGAFNYATLGVGSSSHLSMEMFESMTGTKLSPVHYKGGAPELTDVIGGHIPAVFLSLTLTAEPSKAGQLRTLGSEAPGGSLSFRMYPPLPRRCQAMNHPYGSGFSHRARRRKESWRPLFGRAKNSDRA
jgi:hypothetical protein